MHYIDISIIAAYLIITLLIGLWQARGIKTIKDYTIAGRNYSNFIMVAVLAASWFGGGTSIGKVEKIFSHGTVYLLTTVGIIFQLLLMSEIIVKKFKPYMGLLTVGDIMEKMYGRYAKIFTGFFGVIISVSFLGTQIAALGYFLSAIYGISLLSAVLIGYGIVIIYSALGGIKSVAITDVFQFILIAFMIPALVYYAVDGHGSIASLYEKIPTAKFNFTDISYDNYKYLYMMLVFCIPTLIPMSIQRILMSKNVEQSMLTFRWSVFILFIVSAAMATVALTATVIMPNVNPNQVIPIMIRDLIPIGMKGLVVVGFLAVIMSSADAFLHSSGICLVHDFIKPIFNKEIGAKKELLLTKILTLIMGAFSIIIAVYTESLVETIQRGFSFWMPAVVIPLLAGLFSLKKEPRSYYASFTLGTSAIIICMILGVVNSAITLIAIISSLLGYLLIGKRIKE